MGLRSGYFKGPADCNNYNCNHIILFSESSKRQLVLELLLKQFVVTCHFRESATSAPAQGRQCRLELGEGGSAPKRGRHSTINSDTRWRLCLSTAPSVQWQPDVLTIRTRRCFLGAGFLGAPPIPLIILRDLEFPSWTSQLWCLCLICDRLAFANASRTLFVNGLSCLQTGVFVNDV